MDIFKSVPQKNAIERDWTNETLTVDIENALGELFHFEIAPGEKDNLTGRNTAAPWQDRGPFVLIELPL